jgi:hypothetical protein
LYFQGKWIIIILKSAVPLLVSQNPLIRIAQQSPVDEIMIFPNLGIGIDPTLESPKSFENIEMNLPYSPFEI